jgi:NADPH:quinone reductase
VSTADHRGPRLSDYQNDRRNEMLAPLSRAAGGPETLELGEVPDPTPVPGQVVVAIRACAINYPDVLIIEDQYQFKPARPFAPGMEIAGVIESVGENISLWAVGDRAAHGWLCHR